MKVQQLNVQSRFNLQRVYWSCVKENTFLQLSGRHNYFRLRGATGEISNFYNLSAGLLIFNKHIPPIINTQAQYFAHVCLDTF